LPIPLLEPVTIATLTLLLDTCKVICYTNYFIVDDF
jgi:hypothetical protein